MVGNRPFSENLCKYVANYKDKRLNNYLVFINVDNLVAGKGPILFNELVSVGHGLIVSVSDACFDVHQEQCFLPFLEPLWWWPLRFITWTDWGNCCLCLRPISWHITLAWTVLILLLFWFQLRLCSICLVNISFNFLLIECLNGLELVRCCATLSWLILFLPSIIICVLILVLLHYLLFFLIGSALDVHSVCWWGGGLLLNLLYDHVCCWHFLLFHSTQSCNLLLVNYHFWRGCLRVTWIISMMMLRQFLFGWRISDLILLLLLLLNQLGMISGKCWYFLLLIQSSDWSLICKGWDLWHLICWFSWVLSWRWLLISQT